MPALGPVRIHTLYLIRTVGKLLDADIERDIAKQSETPAVANADVRESGNVGAVSVDSAWLRHREAIRGPGRHVNIVAGRATFAE